MNKKLPKRDKVYLFLAYFVIFSPIFTVKISLFDENLKIAPYFVFLFETNYLSASYFFKNSTSASTPSCGIAL